MQPPDVRADVYGTMSDQGSMAVECPSEAHVSGWAVAGWAAALALVWAASLSRSLYDPLGPDQGLYQYMTEQVMAGKRLYVDVWDQNGPGIIAIHWLATKLFGGTPMSLRVFDAIWQALTVLALAGLARRAGLTRTCGLIAGLLYVTAYYAMGYIQTAQREGFAVLPLLLMAHLALQPSGFARHIPAGALGLFACLIKPPLGLCFGVLWLRAGWHSLLGPAPRRPARAAFAGLTVGFILAGGLALAWLEHIDALLGFLRTLARRDLQPYASGPWMIRAILPACAAAAVVSAVVVITVARGPRRWRPAMAAAGLACLLLTMTCWPAWREQAVRFAGLWIPAVGAVIQRPWAGRNQAWRVGLLLGGATLAALVIQGQFFTYHCPPVLAFGAVIAAAELSTVLRQRGAWPAACAACVAFLLAAAWWPTITVVNAHPNLLSRRSVGEHYTAITRHKRSCPTWQTSVRAAGRVRELVPPGEPVACLLHDPRLLYLCRRPNVHRLICMQEAYAPLFREYMQFLRLRRPAVVLARVPEPLRESADRAAVEEGIFAATESFFGSESAFLRGEYALAEVIDDLALLQPKPHQNISP